MKVLCVSVYPEAGPSVRHRIVAYREAFERAGVRLTIKPLLTAGLFRLRRRFGRFWSVYKVLMFAFCTLRFVFRLAAVPRYDAVIIHREAFPVGPPWFEQLLRRLTPRLYFDVDDAVWEPMPLKIDQRGRWHDPGRFDTIMKSCDAVVVGNDYLRTHADQFNPHVSVIPTPYRDLGGPGRNTASGEPPVIVWIGNVGNEEYLDMLREPLTRLASTHDFVLRVIGSSNVHSLSIDGVKMETHEWSEAAEATLLLSADIGVMPLLDRPYERGKCAFKLIQYFSAGLGVIASPVGMNQQVISSGVNGYLAASSEQWLEHCTSLVSNRDLRAQLARAGYQTFRQQFTPDINATKWLSVLNA